MGDFNIDLLNSETHDEIANYQNNFTNHFYNPLILQPTRLENKTLIDNIFFNSLEYNTYSGNITIQLADHAFQFVIIEGFHKDIFHKTNIIYARNFKNFSEQEFHDKLINSNWNDILLKDKEDPNKNLNNLHIHINNILDELAPLRKLSKNEIRLHTKPWINMEIQQKIYKINKILNKYSKRKNKNSSESIHLFKEYKTIRNKITSMKGNSKVVYYNIYIDNNKNK